MQIPRDHNRDLPFSKLFDAILTEFSGSKRQNILGDFNSKSCWRHHPPNVQTSSMKKSTAANTAKWDSKALYENDRIDIALLNFFGISKNNFLF